MEIKFIPIKLGDVAEEVWALQHAAYRIEAALIGVVDLPPLQDTILSLQASDETFFGAYTDENELIGAISFEADDQTGICTICRLMVHPDYHRRGVGSLLVEHLLSTHSRPTAWGVTAEIRNMPAIALYERYGFVRERIFTPQPGIELLWLVRKSSNQKASSAPTLD